MNKHLLQRTLVAAGVLALVGTAGAQAYYSHELAERVAAQESTPQAETALAPSIEQSGPWAAMHADMMRLQARMDQMFNATFHDGNAVRVGDQQPIAQVTLEEQGDNYVVTADIPGASKDDINVNLDGRLLSISAQSHGDDKQTADNGQVIGEESYASSMQQAFTLPGPVNASGMQTKFQDGILSVTVPKATS